MTLKRGVARGETLRNWHKGIAADATDRRTVTLSVLGEDSAPISRWQLRNAWPSTYDWVPLNAQDGDQAVETLVLAHDGLDRTG